ncbi:MAG: transcription termination/antitermination factor NusG, partial [candidate division WOR-3 bacterium]
MTGQKTWLIFWTRGGEELKTKEKIEKLVRDLKLQDKVEKVFVPTTRTTKYNKKRVKPKLYDIVI